MKIRIWLASFLFAILGGPVFAEVNEIRIARQDGLGYLPLLVMEENKLIEKHVRAAGLPDVKTNWQVILAGNAMNDALLSGNLDIATGGVPPFLVLWGRTKGNLDVKAIAPLVIYPHYLITRNPKIKTIADFTDTDRISVPAIKVSNQAILLQMAAEKLYGVGKHETLDRFTVALPPADTTAALISGGSEINTMYSTPPYQYQLMERSDMHVVAKSFDALGGPTSVLLIWSTGKFQTANPKTGAAIYAALGEAQEFIKNNPRAAAQIYIKASNTKDTPESILKMMSDMEFGGPPKNVMSYANFMTRVGSLKTKPDSWRDLFFPNIHALPGS